MTIKDFKNFVASIPSLYDNFGARITYRNLMYDGIPIDYECSIHAVDCGIPEYNHDTNTLTIPDACRRPIAVRALKLLVADIPSEYDDDEFIIKHPDWEFSGCYEGTSLFTYVPVSVDFDRYLHTNHIAISFTLKDGNIVSAD